MKQNLNTQSFSILFVIFAVLSFFYGFYVDEVSMGAGGYDGDFLFVLRSIDLFSNNSIKDSILLFSETSNRPPLIYIIHKLFNPFFSDELNFRRSVFIMSLSIPVLFFLCLKEKFKNTNKILLVLLSSVILFNPFIRNSAFWGLEENYAIITSLLTFLFYLKISNQNNLSEISLPKIFALTFSSALCVYFDQKFIIIPLLCFLKIFLGDYSRYTKIVTSFFYILFATPYLFLISLWGGIFPSNIYHIGNQFYFHHLGFALTIIAFIFFPFLIFQNKNIKDEIKNFLKKNNLLLLILPIFVYVLFLIFFYENSFFNDRSDGGGVIKKISFIFFDNLIFRKIFIYTAFILSWFFIIFFLNHTRDKFFLIYFIFIALITKPFYQEYFDPIIFIMLFFFFKINFQINYIKIYSFYFYYLFFLTGTIVYYH
jgi:hypothetical protein